MRKLFLATSAALLLGSPALAADIPVKAAPPAAVAYYGFFGYIEGFYAFRQGNGEKINTNILQTSAAPGSGYGGAGRLGYRFNQYWDIAVSGSFTRFGEGPRVGTAPANLWSVTKATLSTINGELGYNIQTPDLHVRPYVGIQYHQVRHEMRYHPDIPLNCCFNNSEAKGIGPLVGFDATARLAQTPFSMIVGANAAVLFGDVKSEAGPAFTPRPAEDRTMANFGGYLGGGWDVTRNVQLGAGYRWQVSRDTFFKEEGNAVQTGRPNGGGPRTAHGPFARLSASFSGN